MKRRRTMIILVVVANILGSGCVATSPEEAETTSSAAGATPAPSNPEPLPTTTDVAVPIAHKLNMTNCQGALAQVALVGPVIREHVPENYSIGDETDALANVLLWVHNCEKVSVDGRDIGPASFQYLSVDILDPADAPPAADVLSRYVFETTTDHDELRTWFEAAGIAATRAATTVSATPGVPYLTETVGTVIDESGALLYAFTAYPYESTVARARLERYFHGPDPASDYTDNEVNGLVSAGGGPGNLTVGATSALSALLRGAPAAPIQAQNFDSIARVVTPPATS